MINRSMFSKSGPWSPVRKQEYPAADGQRDALNLHALAVVIITMYIYIYSDSGFLLLIN